MRYPSRVSSVSEVITPAPKIWFVVRTDLAIFAARPARRAHAPPSSPRTTTTKRPHPARSSRPSRRRRRRARSGRVGRPPTPARAATGARACVSVPSGATFSARRTSLCLDAVSGWYSAIHERDVRATPRNGADREHHQTRHHHPDRQPHRWFVRGGRLSPPAAAEQRRVLRSWRSRHRTSDPRGVARLQYHIARPRLSFSRSVASSVDLRDDISEN